LNQDLTRYENSLDTTTDAKLMDFASKLNENVEILTVYEDLSINLRGIIEASTNPDPNAPVKLTEEQKKKITELNNLSGEAKKLILFYQKLIDKTANKMGKAYEVLNITKPEKQLNTRDRNIRDFSRAQSRTGKLFYKMYQEVQQKAAFATDAAINKLKSVEEKIAAAATSRGITQMELFKTFLTSEYEYEGKKTVKLIDRHDAAIRKQLKELLASTDTKKARAFINEYIDLDAYVKDYEERKEDQFAYIDNQIFYEDEAKNITERKRKKADFIAKFDISKSTAINSQNNRIAYFLNDKAYSENYKKLKDQPDIFELYQLQIAANKRAAELGMIPWKQLYSFVPNVRKTYVDRLVQGGNKNPFKTILDAVRVEPGADNIFGAINPITREPLQKIPVNFVYDLTTEEKSQEFIKNLALWEKEINEYEWRSELEGSAKILRDVERRKKTLVAVRRDGETQYDEVPKQNQNDKNTEYLENFINYYIYGKKLSGQAEDLSFTMDLRATAKKINEKVGFKMLSEFEEEEGEVVISGIKAVQAANRWFQMKVLGFNLGTPISNLVGGAVNSVISSGKYFTRQEYLINTTKLTSMLGGERGEIYAKMIDYFMPLVENQENFNINKLSSSKVTEYMTSEILFALQKYSDKAITYPMLLSMIENSVVIDGKIVNIPEYVREQNGYLGRFKLPKDQRLALEQKINDQIEKMKENSIMKTAKLVDGQLVIDGVDRSDRSVWELRNKVQALSRNVLGASSPEAIAQYRMTLFGQSFMMFKNWIPGMALVRFGGLKENVGEQSWEYGRLRLMFKLITQNGLSSIRALRDVMELNENGVKYMRNIYRQKLDKFLKEGGEQDEFLSEEEFMEIHYQGIKMAAKEAQFWVGMLGLLISAKMGIGDDREKDEYTGVLKFGMRTLDKVYDELGFWFNPKSAMDIANGSVFPALGTVNDALTFMNHFTKEASGAIFGVEEWQESAKPTKYLFKTFPITKEMLTYIGIFNQDLAEEMGIRISNQYSVR
jgi:hypothetical protein